MICNGIVGVKVASVKSILENLLLDIKCYVVSNKVIVDKIKSL